MAKKDEGNQPIQIKRWAGGISDYLKESAVPDAFYFGVSINFRDDPQSVTLLPGAKNESGSIVTDLLKWGELVPDTSLNSYFSGDGGNIYKRTNTGVWSLLHSAAASHGNGLGYFTGDGYLYYANDSALGRYGQITDVFAIYENWGNGISATWFDWSQGKASVANGLLTIATTTAAGFYGVELAQAQNLTGYSITNQLVDVGSRSLSSYEVYPLYATIRGDPSNQVFWFINATNDLRAYKKVAGANTIVASGTYSSATHKYFRIREASGTIYWDTSTDNTNWTNFTSTSNPFAITSMTIGQEVGTSGEATTTAAVFDNFSFAPTVNSAQFSDNFLRAQGGVPLNTASLSLVSASSQYADAADSASLSQTGNITLEAFAKFTTLPAVGSSMTLIGKWDESGTLRSYKMDIYGVSGFFGDGSAGALTISANTTQSLTDSACTAAASSRTINATNGSFAAGQVILVYQTQGTNYGQYERNTIQSYTAGTITTGTPLLGSYGTGAQVIVIPQYSSVTVNSGITWTAKAWTGTVGGTLLYLSIGGTACNGTINAQARGFRVGQSASAGEHGGQQGEGVLGTGSESTSPNGTGGGGGGVKLGGDRKGGGGGGSHATAGTIGNAGQSDPGAAVGGTGATLFSGTTDLTSATYGGGGGQGGYGTTPALTAGDGGGFVFISSVSFTMGGSGLINANGENGSNSSDAQGANGGGAGGSVRLNVQTANIGTNQITVAGGTGGTTANPEEGAGGAGGIGRISISYLTSLTGTTTPTANNVQDNSLVTNVSYQLRIGISSTGLNSEFLTKVLPNLQIGQWNRFSVSWQATISTATFYVNAESLGSSVGTLTAIHNNTSLLYVGADKGASAVGNFLNGLIDDVRIWGNVQSAAQIAANNVTQVSGTAAGLQAYWKFNSAATDSTANANTLTLRNTPVYVTTDVPFPDATTRLDIDQSYTTGGSTYALGTAISEAAADILSFTPAKDPQASVDFKVTTKGTGDYIVTVHDQQNRVIATQTILAANIPASGYIEFIFTLPWRLVLGKTYHMHLTSTVADGVVEASSLNNINTATYHTYFGFLVTDTQFHPIVPFLNFMVIGNERYLATWDGAFYQPNLIAFPTGAKVRALGFWREFLAIGVWRGNNITDFDQGKIYFWDGIAPTFNFFIDVPQGQIAALYGKDSDLFFFAGYRGVLMKYTGGGMYTNGNSASVKLKRIPKIAPSDYLDIYPGALTMWRDLVHFGVAANSSSDTVNRAVYSWGSLNQLYPETLSCDYPISTGNMFSSVSVGLTFPIGQSLIIGWRDGVATGADVINFNNPYAATGSIQTLVFDDQALWKDKLNFDVRADHLPFIGDESVNVGISIDREDFTTGGDVSTDSEFTKMPFASGRGREYQLSVELLSTGDTTPTLLALGVLHDDTMEEQQW